MAFMPGDVVLPGATPWTRRNKKTRDVLLRKTRSHTLPMFIRGRTVFTNCLLMLRGERLREGGRTSRCSRGALLARGLLSLLQPAFPLPLTFSEQRTTPVTPPLPATHYLNGTAPPPQLALYGPMMSWISGRDISVQRLLVLPWACRAPLYLSSRICYRRARYSPPATIPPAKQTGGTAWIGARTG